MESYSEILEAIENNEDYASVIAKVEQELKEIPQKIETAEMKLAALHEEENSYNTYQQNFQAVLNAAKNNILNLNKNCINEIRFFARPPKAVERVAEGILILLGSNNLSYDAFRKIAADQLLNVLLNFDINSITKKKIADLKPIIDEFQGREETIRNASIAAFGLWNWVFGVYQIFEIQSQFRSIGQIRAEINEKVQEIDDLKLELHNGVRRIEALKERIEKINNA